MVPVYITYRFFSKKSRGIIAGVIIGGFGFGAFISSQIIFYLINPNNVKPHSESGEKYFGKDIADKVPSTLRYLALYYFCLSTIGSLLMFDPPSEEDQLND